MKTLFLTCIVTFIFQTHTMASTCDRFLSNYTFPSLENSNVTSINTHSSKFSKRTQKFRADIQNLARKSLSFKADEPIPVRIPAANIELLHVVEDTYVKVRRALFIQSLYNLDLKLVAITPHDRPHAFVSLLMQRRAELFQFIRDLDKVTFDRVNAFYVNDFDGDKTDRQEIEFSKRILAVKENLLEEDQIVETQIQETMAILMDENFK